MQGTWVVFIRVFEKLRSRGSLASANKRLDTTVQATGNCAAEAVLPRQTNAWTRLSKPRGTALLGQSCLGKQTLGHDCPSHGELRCWGSLASANKRLDTTVQATEFRWPVGRPYRLILIFRTPSLRP
ncbi:MAG: hypothetical protein KatS3mg020_0734 [Fimbriimonadales bacterium]|nr:MAG: hypothetical protein KatS3mg020_0734 [Fimbriimonadales bacterium]